jgi:hypothetical protein
VQLSVLLVRSWGATCEASAQTRPAAGVLCCSCPPRRLLSTSVTLIAADGVRFANQTDALLRRQDFVGALQRCSNPGASCPTLSMCYPCHCSLLSKVGCEVVPCAAMCLRASGQPHPELQTQRLPCVCAPLVTAPATDCAGAGGRCGLGAGNAAGVPWLHQRARRARLRDEVSRGAVDCFAAAPQAGWVSVVCNRCVTAE